MPRVTIWIRNEDMSKWKAIEDRPEFIHRAVNGQITQAPYHPEVPKFEPVKDFIKKNSKGVWCKEHGMEKSICKGFKHKS